MFLTKDPFDSCGVISEGVISGGRICSCNKSKQIENKTFVPGSLLFRIPTTKNALQTSVQNVSPQGRGQKVLKTSNTGKECCAE